MASLTTYCNAGNGLRSLLHKKRVVEPTAICTCYSLHPDPKGHDAYGCDTYGTGYNSIGAYDRYGGGYATLGYYFDAGNPGSGVVNCNSECPDRCADVNADFSSCLH